MAIPWNQVTKLAGPIVEVALELLKLTKQTPRAAALASQNHEALAARIAALEENERRQAELVARMAEQLASITRAMDVLHKRVLWLSAASVIAVVIAVTVLIATR
jgi:hypothetical protein